MTDQTNWLGDEQQAKKLARRIRNYWRRRGHDVQLFLEDNGNQMNRGSVFSIRSDMIDGYPRTWSEA